jgi:hypothetical protein
MKRVIDDEPHSTPVPAEDESPGLPVPVFPRYPEKCGDVEPDPT